MRGILQHKALHCPCFFVTAAPEYVEAYAAATRPGEKAAGKFRAIILGFQASNEFRSRSARTQKDYRAWLAAMLREAG